MSALLMGRAFYTSLPSHLRFLLVALCDHANDEGEDVFVGQARLAAKVGAGERTVRRNLGELRDAGYIERVGRMGSRGQDRHIICIDRLPSLEDIRDVGKSRPAKVADRPPASAVDRPPVAAEPSVQPSEEKNLRSSLSRKSYADLVWDAVDTAYGKVANDAERGRRGKVVKLLRQTGAEPEQIIAVVTAARRDPDSYVQHMAATDTALANNWSRILTAMEHTPNGIREGQGGRLLREAAEMRRRDA